MGLDLLFRAGALPKLVAHRGASAVAPENTLVAFERAWLDGADLIELDLRMTADGHVVVMHDATVDRTTDSTGTVSEMTLDALKRLDAGAWFDVRYRGEAVPTLAETLDWAVGKVGLLLELKFPFYGPYDPALVTAVAPAIRGHPMAGAVAFISYQPQALVQMKALLPGVPAGPLQRWDRTLRLGVWLTEHFPFLSRISVAKRLLERPLAFTRRWGCDVVAPNIELATPTLVAATHAAGYPISCGGLRWDYDRALAIGVDTVSANDPAVVRARFLVRKARDQSPIDG